MNRPTVRHSGTPATAGRTGAGHTGGTRGVLNVSTHDQFRALLDALRKTRKLSYTQIGAKAGKGMSRSTAQAMITNDALPTIKHLRLFLKGCGVTLEETALWERTWHHLDQLSRPVDPITPQPPTLRPNPPEKPSRQPGNDKPGHTRSVTAELGTATPSHDSPPPARTSGRSASDAVLRAGAALASLVVVVGVLTASAIAMSVTHVPVEVILTVFAVITVCITSGVLLLRHNHLSIPRQRVRFEKSSDVYEDSIPKAAPPVIGY